MMGWSLGGAINLKLHAFRLNQRHLILTKNSEHV